MATVVRFQPDLPDSLSIQGQIVRFATYLYPVLSAFSRVLIVPQVAKAELAKIRQTVSTKSFLGGWWRSTDVHLNSIAQFRT
jgi:hypothetical protein